MAKFVKKNEPAQATYVFEFTQDEVDMLGGIVLDLADNFRKVEMHYPIDGDAVVPNAKGKLILSCLSTAFDKTGDGGLDYDYFEFWDYAEG